jgi:hypothetical protein
MSRRALRLAGHSIAQPVSVGLEVPPAPEFMSDPRRGCAPANLQHHPDYFFSIYAHERATARNTCAGCPFKTDCFTYAIEHGETAGIWGGQGMENRPRPAKKATPKPVATPRLTKEQTRVHLERQVRELWERDLSDSTIAVNLGLHCGAVTRIRNRLGLPALYGAGGKRLPRTVVNA